MTAPPIQPASSRTAIPLPHQGHLGHSTETDTAVVRVARTASDIAVSTLGSGASGSSIAWMISPAETAIASTSTAG